MRLLAFGKANTGQLGVNEKVPEYYDKPVFSEGNIWVKVKCGGYHTVALSVQGNLFAWGAGWNGQLGLGKNVQKQFVPRPVSIFEEVTIVSKLSCGTSHTVVITADKKVFSWGGDSGDSGLRQISIPNGVTLKSISAGNAFTLAVSTDGQVYSWGTGLDGRLGVGNTRNFRNPQKVVFPSNDSAQIKAAHVAAGKAHGLALTATGQIYSWGCNTKGQLGLGSEEDQFTPSLVSKLTGVKRIAAGESHSVALTDKGVMFAWGDGESGQLGLPNVTIQNEPAVISTLPEGVKIVRIAAGQLHTLAISEYGDVFAWGDNSCGQLGTGNTENSSSAVYLDTLPENAFAAKVAAGERHSIILVTDFNRFEKENEAKYASSLKAPPPPSKPSSPAIGTAAIIANSPAQKRKSARRSVKFNLEAAFAEMEGDLLAMDEDGDDENEEEIVIENAGGKERKDDDIVVSVNVPKTEGDAIFGEKKKSRAGCGCVIL